MSATQSGIKGHDDTVLRAENARQAVAVAGATQAAVMSADVVYHRAFVKSALASGVSPAASMQALRELYQTGQ